MIDRRRSVVIVGAGPQGRIILEVCLDADLPVQGFLDDTRAVGEIVEGVAVLGRFADITDPALTENAQFVVALGEPNARLQVTRQIIEHGGTLAMVTHPSCYISPSARVESGSFVNYATAIYAGARVGPALILDTHASIGHDCEIGAGVFIGPGARLTGGVRCGPETFVGAAAVVLPNVTIGRAALIGAGSVVTRDVADGAVVAGNPARPTEVAES